MTSQPPRARNFGRSNKSGTKPAGPKPEPKILFQQFFKSVGPRTYVAQLKQAANGNHFLVLTEGKRDEKTNELRKSRLFLYSEDFVAFFRLMKQTATFISTHPVDPKVKAKQAKMWARKGEQKSSGSENGTARSADPGNAQPASGEHDSSETGALAGGLTSISAGLSKRT